VVTESTTAYDCPLLHPTRQMFAAHYVTITRPGFRDPICGRCGQYIRPGQSGYWFADDDHVIEEEPG
jgi:hypothetical protein